MAIMNRIKLLRSSTTGAIPATTGAGDVGEIAANLIDRKLYIRDASGAPIVLADRITSYSASQQYAAGDFAVQNNVIYRNTTPITIPEAFNAAKWVAMGATVGLDPAVLLAPDGATRNRITPTNATYPALELRPFSGQSANLLDVNGTKHDSRGLPIGRYGETVFLVSQTGHGFTVIGEPAAYVHPNWVKADSDDAGKAVRAIVHEVIDANNVLLQTSGRVAALNVGAFIGGAISAGQTYYLSTTPGKLTTTPPAVGAQPVLLTLTTTTAVILLSNAAGAVLTVSAPGPQTVFSALKVSIADGTRRLDFDPQLQKISSSAGTPATLAFNEDGTLTSGGGIIAGGPLRIPTNAAYGLQFGANDTLRIASSGAGAAGTIVSYVNGALKLTLSATALTAAAGVDFTGSGAGLTALPSASLTGTIADARLPSTMTSKNITGNLIATGVVRGTVEHAESGGYFRIGTYDTGAYGAGGARIYADPNNQRLVLDMNHGGIIKPIGLTAANWGIEPEGNARFGTVRLAQTPAGNVGTGYISTSTGTLMQFRSGTDLINFRDVGGNVLGQVSPGTAVPSSVTLITRQMGDLRYFNASNMNAGTLDRPVDVIGTVRGSLMHRVDGGYMYVGSYDTGSYGSGSARLWYNSNGRDLTMLSHAGADLNVIAGSFTGGHIGNGASLTNIPTAYSGVGGGAVGSVRLLLSRGGGDGNGDTVAGSDLRSPALVVDTDDNDLKVTYSSGPGGTWRAMQSTTAAGSSQRGFANYVRIS